MTLPSKELLSAVLGGAIKSFSIDKNNVYYDIDHGTCINIYELAHKCKEWAYAEHLKELSSYKSRFGGWVCTAKGMIMFCEQTEPEAIFKACQWILENK